MVVGKPITQSVGPTTMKPIIRKWILAAVLTTSSLCIAGMFCLVIFQDVVAAFIFPSPGRPPILEIDEIESIIGLKLPIPTQIEFAESAYDNNTLYQSWILKTSQPPFTSTQITALSAFSPSTSSPRDGAAFMEKQMKRSLNVDQYGLAGDWQYQDWDISFQIVHAEACYYTKMNAQSLEYLTYQKPNGQYTAQRKSKTP